MVGIADGGVANAPAISRGEAARQGETGKTIRPCAYRGFLPVYAMADACRKGITDAAGIDFR